jgi:hypothetical protein
MSLHFSFHAAMRCIERGISEKAVLNTVLFGFLTAYYGTKVIYEHGRMRVVCTVTGEVITVFRKKRVNPKRNLRKARKERRKFFAGIKT